MKRVKRQTGKRKKPTGGGSGGVGRTPGRAGTGVVRRKTPRARQARASSIGRGAAMQDTGPAIRRRIFDVYQEPLHREAVGEIVHRYEGSPSRVIAMMQDIQDAFGYLPEGDLRLLSEEIGLPLKRIYGIATFYKAFRLMPRGRHEIKLCTGTACHVRGAEGVRDAITRELGIHEGETTEDMRFSFETVHCLGCCGLAPVMMIDDDIHGKVGYSVEEILEKYR